MVWDWRSFHSLVPKVASFGVGHKEEREHKPFTRRRELTTDYVVFGGRLRRGCFAPFNPIPDAHTPGKRRAKKKSAANVTKGWHIYPPVIYCICWRATRFFDWPLRTTLPLFAPPRSTGLVFPVSAGFVNLPANVFSYNYFPLLSFSTICQKDNVTEGWHPPPSVI